MKKIYRSDAVSPVDPAAEAEPKAEASPQLVKPVVGRGRSFSLPVFSEFKLPAQTVPDLESRLASRAEIAAAAVYKIKKPS